MAKKALKRTSVRLDPDNEKNLKDYCQRSILNPSMATIANYLIRVGFPKLTYSNEPQKLHKRG